MALDNISMVALNSLVYDLLFRYNFDWEKGVAFKLGQTWTTFIMVLELKYWFLDSSFLKYKRKKIAHKTMKINEIRQKSTKYKI